MRVGDLEAGACGSPSADFTLAPPSKPKQGLLERRTGLFSTDLLCVLLLRISLLVGIRASLSSLPSFSIMREKVGLTPGLHSHPVPLSRKAVRLSH